MPLKEEGGIFHNARAVLEAGPGQQGVEREAE